MRLLAMIAAVALPVIAYFAFAVGNNLREDGWEKAIADLRNPDLGVRRKAAESLSDLALAFRSVRRTTKLADTMNAHMKIFAEYIRNKKEDSQVRVGLIHMLGVGEFGSIAQAAAPALIDALRDEADDERVRGESAMILPYIAPPDQTGPVILSATKSRSQIVRINALQALNQLAVDPDALLPLLARAIDDPERSARIAAAAEATRLVKERGDRRALPILLRAANDPDGQVKQSATLLLQSLGTDAKDAEAALVALLKDPNPSIRASSATALMEITGDAAKYAAILTEMLRSKEAADREAAAQALVPSGPRATALVPVLTDALHDPVERVRVYAASALLEITGKAADYAPILVEALASRDERVQWWAAGALDLVAMHDEAALELPLLQATRHKNPAVRIMALTTLWTRGLLSRDRAAALEMFTAALQDESPDVRARSLEFLGDMGHEAQPALPEIKRALRDADETVRNKAQQALRKILGPPDGGVP
jgi:HEAT repeat protein